MRICCVAAQQCGNWIVSLLPRIGSAGASSEGAHLGVSGGPDQLNRETLEVAGVEVEFVRH